jgi:aspartate kinase
MRDDNVAKVSVVGIGMKSQAGVAARAFAALARDRINIQMISTSEISISVIVVEGQADEAVRSLHREFIA